MKLLGNYSGIMERYHNQPKFVPADYKQKAEEIFGAIPRTKKPGKHGGVSLYDKVIALVQSKYPGLASCCIIAYLGIASTALTSMLGLLACCCAWCCEKQACRSCCRAKPRRELCDEEGCGCCGADEVDPARRDQYRPVRGAESLKRQATEPEDSRQRDTTLSTIGEDPEAQPMPLWATLRAGPSAPSTN